MKRTMLVPVLCLFLAAATAAAQEVDAETRFHRAYEKEVVDGKTADAARVYLDMMRDEKVPERLRAEAKFRFAVTSVLLGRSDEARAHLAELVKDAKTPEALRARATEYLDAAKGIGVGSELDKKLQALVFELGRESDANNNPNAYRDFEVIGRQAAPFLKQLVQHNDVAIRRHAFRLLMRLREPGTMQLWTPELHLSGLRYGGDLTLFLRERPEERPTLEQKLLGLDDAALKGVVKSIADMNYGIPVSSEFFRAAARRAEPVPLVSWLEQAAGRDEALQRLRVEWIGSEDAELAKAAILSFLRASGTTLPEWVDPAALLPVIVRRLAEMKSISQQEQSAIYSGVRALANRLPIEARLNALEAVLADAAHPRRFLIADTMAWSLHEPKPDAESAERYAALLRKWIEFGSVFPDSRHLHVALAAMPMEQATEFATWLFDHGNRTGIDWSAALPNQSPERIPLALAAYRSAGRHGPAVLRRMVLTDDAGTVRTEPAYARAMLAAIPDFVRTAIEVKEQTLPVAKFPAYAQQLPPAEAQERLVAMVQALAASGDVNARRSAYAQIFWTRESQGAPAQLRYWVDVVLPAMERVWATVPAQDREATFRAVLQILHVGLSQDRDLRESVAAFTLAHADELPHRASEFLATAPSMFPPAAWIPRAPAGAVTGGSWPVEIVDPAVREMTRDPNAVRPGVLHFVRLASGPLRTETFDHLLRTAPVDRVAMVVAALEGGGGPVLDYASAEALEDALGRLMATDRLDIKTVSRLVTALATRKPSERLFPAIRLILSSRDTIYPAIAAAKSLGREELLPDLAAALDSMNADIRQQAREAIDSIVELRRLREEARRNAAATPPK